MKKETFITDQQVRNIMRQINDNQIAINREKLFIESYKLSIKRRKKDIKEKEAIIESGVNKPVYIQGINVEDLKFPLHCLFYSSSDKKMLPCFITIGYDGMFYYQAHNITKVKFGITTLISTNRSLKELIKKTKIKLINGNGEEDEH